MERLTSGTDQQSAWGWSEDGTTLLFQQVSASTGWDTFAMSLTDPGEPVPVLQSPSYDGAVAVAPDFRWVAYTVAYTSGGHVYISPFPEVSRSRVQVSTTGGGRARWSRDGKTLYYRDGSRIMAAKVETQAGLSIDTPVVVLDDRYASGGGEKDWDVAADGRFLLMKTVPAAATINVTLNWDEELRERVPIP